MVNMQLKIRPACTDDIEQLRLLYDEIIDAMDASRWHAQWRKDGYPSREDLLAKAIAAELWVCEYSGELAAAMVLNHSYNPGYSQAPWQVECGEDEVLCIHTLGVSPRFQRCGIASAMVHQAIAIARASSCKCLRLDVINTNRPADLLYLRLGFCCRGAFTLNYEGAVCTQFNLYEYVL